MGISLLWNLPPCKLLHPSSYDTTSSKYPWYLMFEPPSCLISVYSLTFYSHHLQITSWSGGWFSVVKGTCVESCCLSFWRTAAQEERNTKETGSDAINLRKTREQSKPKARQLVRRSHHCLWSCRLLRFAWSVIFLNRKLILPPSSQRLNQDGAMWSLPGVSPIPVLWHLRYKD